MSLELPLELTLMRHGQSEADLLDVIECNADFALTDLGRSQAARLARHWVQHPPGWTALYASPLARARETASIVADVVGLDIVFDPRLAEKNVGEMAGLSRSDAELRYPKPPGGLLPHQRMGGGTGESLLDFRHRVHESLWDLRERHQGQHIAIVAHGGVLNEVLRLLLGNTSAIFVTGDACWHHVIWGDQLKVMSLNRRPD